MSNELAIRGTTDDWTGMLPDVMRLSDQIAKTAFVPKGLKGDPAAVLAAILSGREIGLPPITAMAHIDVIDGMPTLDPEMMRAIVLREGHELIFKEMTASRCVIDGRRKGAKDFTRVAFSMDEARAMGLAAKDNWKKQPQNMLVARCTGRICRLIFPDVIGGLSYIPEEISSGVLEGVIEDEVEKPKRTAQRAKAQAKAPVSDTPIKVEVTEVVRFTNDLPPLPGDVDQETGEITPDPVTEAQVKKIIVQFHDLGIEDRDRRLEIASAAVRRPVTSTKELTKSEGSSLIEHLDHLLSLPSDGDNYDEIFDKEDD